MMPEQFLVAPPSVQPFSVPEAQLRADIAAGLAPPTIMVSSDGGASWKPAHEALRLPPPADVRAMALIVPISTSFLAIAAGYWGLLSLVAFLGWLLVALLPQPGGLTLIFVRTGLITSAFCGAPSLLLAHFARRSLAKNASLLGRGRIRFAEFAAAAMLVTIVVAMVRQAVYVP